MRFLQEVRGYDLVTNRQPSSRLGSIYQMQLRSHMGETSHPLRRRLSISVNAADISNSPHPVKIQVAAR